MEGHRDLGQEAVKILNGLVMEEPEEEVTFEQRLEDEGGSPVDFWEKSALNKENSKRKGPEVGVAW